MRIKTSIEVMARVTDIMKNTIKNTLLKALFRSSLTYILLRAKAEGDNLVWLVSY